MQFAPVLPPELYPKMDTGMYHMVQAHMIDGNRRIREWCRDRINFNHIVIVDNGAAELGNGDVAALISVASSIRPSIVVAPDVFGNRTETFMQFQANAHQMLDLAPGVMAVPHGTGVVDSLECTIDMLDFWSTRGYCLDRLHIGVPKLLDIYTEYGRHAFVYNLVNTLDFPQRRIHLLGLNSGLHELASIIKEFPNLMGWDTTWPCAAGLDEHAIHMTELNHNKRSLFPGEWWMTEADVNIKQWSTMQLNIEHCRDYTREAQHGT